ncbi:MAG TPA: type II toxin-antitoxin system PemK/MazF family toxin [Acidimicrobiia bacterium]
MESGELFLAPFLYASLAEMKRRPVCIVSAQSFNAGPDVVVAMVTSRATRRSDPGVGDVVIEDWRSAGLLAPSTVRSGRLQSMEARLLDSRLGKLVEGDLTKVRAALRRVLELD